MSHKYNITVGPSTVKTSIAKRGNNGEWIKTELKTKDGICYDKNGIPIIAEGGNKVDVYLNKRKLVPDYGEDTKSSDNPCGICLDNNKCCAIKPCGHICTCIKCSQEQFLCPICREKVTSVDRIYLC